MKTLPHEHPDRGITRSGTDNDRVVVLAAFVGDSLALGAHWIYDTALIEKQFGRVDNLMKPRSQSYHEGWSPTGKPVAPLSLAELLRNRRDLVVRHPARP